ncbi:carbohydrate ABC transporter permease [Bifidobacterium stellenboschense]|uniref:ABC transporter, permease protein, probably raffinose/stachyose transporter n=1 Tax=Bifidobacterium stellenboschense TaxID=762211 RepID=A0A087DBR3_9BIFI|nr:carbohydrate ABC transporter permease [Bifidobacterium stellenboschense]KFI92963.1 ABC transporter, permease protein, probably raffinose/stachyose transporter [Bifidobacterium stellenboschense]
MTPSQRAQVGKIVRTVLINGLAIIMAIPLYYIVINTFKTTLDMAKSPFGLPEHWSLQHYVDVFGTLPIVQSFINSIIVTVFAVFFEVMIGALAAYGMILRNSKFTAAVGAVLMIAFCIPVQATLIPLYKMEASVGLVDSLLGLIILYLANSIFCYMLTVGYMRKLPMEVLEAARIDGAGPFRIFRVIVLPMITPILATVVVFQTLSTWNDFMLPNIFLTSTDLRTVILQVYNAMGQFTTDWPAFMTITVIALVPVVIFFIFCQRWIVSGLVAGSVKG